MAITLLMILAVSLYGLGLFVENRISQRETKRLREVIRIQAAMIKSYQNRQNRGTK